MSGRIRLISHKLETTAEFLVPNDLAVRGVPKGFSRALRKRRDQDRAEIEEGPVELGGRPYRTLLPRAVRRRGGELGVAATVRCHRTRLFWSRRHCDAHSGGILQFPMDIMKVGGTDEGSLGALLSMKTKQARHSLYSRNGRPAACEGRSAQQEAVADLSATVRAKPTADLRFHLGRQRAKVRLRQQPQDLNGQGKRLVIAVQAGERLLGR